ncbi:hypothetical protein BDB00DRAFT_794587 [Zychaea mexicana]|uniref:uncharacterized protein n=1 Tax=Zychaea mexicana TaxID=64656 RepID=UPI0022FE8D9A|nr:uncharacterized protein BDB00DRAFT_794587 [Zychaea mexicana]KAI9499588.1 hypothetical protein BDB00DRAFT_794587 [Zychaea mexicana]
MGQCHFCKLDSFSFCPILVSFFFDCKKIVQHGTSKTTIQCLCCRHLDKMNAPSEAEEAPSYFEKNDNLSGFSVSGILGFREDDINRPELQRFPLVQSYTLLRHFSKQFYKARKNPPHFFTCPRGPTPSFTLVLAHYDTCPSIYENLLEASLIRVIKVSFSRNLLRFTLLLTTDQNCSIGLSSGEYGGK